MDLEATSVLVYSIIWFDHKPLRKNEFIEYYPPNSDSLRIQPEAIEFIRLIKYDGIQDHPRSMGNHNVRLFLLISQVILCVANLDLWT